MISRFLLRSMRLRSCAMTAGALLLACGATAGGQQACRPVTAIATASVTDFLQSPIEQPWLRAHAIMDTSASQLSALVDASDGALCARMDSTLTPDRGVYFRAGAYIIGTIVTPLVVGSPVFDIGSPIFIFDSIGTWVHKGGMSVTVTGDLRVSSATNGRVALVWSNRSQSLTGLRLQRATGMSAFVNTGNILSVSATSITDSTVVTGTTYRYRLAGANANGDSGYSNSVTALARSLGTISQTTSGLLFRDQFNRANGPVGSSWTVESGAWAISNNSLEIAIAGSQSAVLRLSAIADRKDFHVQLMSTRSNLVNYASIYARRSGGNMYLADLGSSAEHSGNARLYRQTGGSYALLGYGDTTAIANTPYRLTFSVIGNSLRFYSNGRRLFSVADTTAGNNINGNLALNTYAQGDTGTIRIDDLILCSSRIVTMTGLPIGHVMRVGSIVSGPATSSGSVSLDLLASPLPVSAVEILDEEDVMVQSFTPANGVCGGDTYALTSP